MIPSPAKLELSDDSVKQNQIESQNIIDQILQNKLQPGCFYVQLAHISKTVNSALENRIFVTDKRSLKKHAKKRFKYLVFILCAQCNTYRENGFCQQCELLCSKKERDYIIYIQLRQQIKYYLKKHFRQIIKYLIQTKDRNDSLKDI